MIESLVNIKCPNRYFGNKNQHILFGIEDSLFFHIGELIKYHILLKPILKTRQVTLIKKFPPTTSVKSLPVLLLHNYLTYFPKPPNFYFTAASTTILFPSPPLQLLCVEGGGGARIGSNIISVHNFLVLIFYRSIRSLHG